MNTKKVAITMPIDLVTMIDSICKSKKISRSKFISITLREKVSSEKERQIREAYNKVFSDEMIRKEQTDTALWFDGTGNKEGQEW
jgi:metal-responsive CopG/Arc/MetJ family transcriptional regulator